MLLWTGLQPPPTGRARVGAVGVYAPGYVPAGAKFCLAEAEIMEKFDLIQLIPRQQSIMDVGIL